MESEDDFQSDNKDENYTGVKLMPRMFAQLMINNLDGKRFRRRDAIDIIEKDFVRQGGSIDQVDGVSVFKKATSYLTDKGLSHPAHAYGIWELHYQKPLTEIVHPIEQVETVVKFDAELGSGDESVYVYYFDVYHQLAQKQNKSFWPCKIGMSTDNAYSRIADQEKTVFPEMPRLALLVHTDNALQLEKTIHSILTLWGKKMDSPGDEWYLTNVDEIRQIIEFLSSNLGK